MVAGGPVPSAPFPVCHPRPVADEDADIPVLDEATSDLDATIERRIRDGIESMAREYAIVAIAHRLSTSARPTGSTTRTWTPRRDFRARVARRLESSAVVRRRSSGFVVGVTRVGSKTALTRVEKGSGGFEPRRDVLTALRASRLVRTALDPHTCCSRRCSQQEVGSGGFEPPTSAL